MISHTIAQSTYNAILETSLLEGREDVYVINNRKINNKLKCTHRVRTHVSGIVICYSLGGDTDNSNTAWKRSCNVIVLVPLSECEKNAIVVGNEVLLCSVIDPVTFEPQNSTTSRVSQGHSLHQV